MDFQYIPTNIPGSGCDLDDVHDEIPGCDCGIDAKCVNTDECVCLRYGQNYDSETGRLVNDDSGDQPIFECGSSCNCGQNCGNRIVQNGIQIALDVFDAGEKGYGLRTRHRLKRGQFVCEYAGEIIDIAEASHRFNAILDGDPNYIFVLREHSGSSQIVTCIDPTRFGNLGRFINHSCDPNLSVLPVRYDNIIPHLAFFANRDMEAAEELCYDYGGDSPVDPGISLSTKPCRCGTQKCRGFLPLDKDLVKTS